MQHAAAYKRANGWYIHADSRTTAGVWIASPPYVKLGLDADPDKLGQAVLDALKESHESIPHPKQWNNAYPVIELAGVETYTEFVTGASYVGILADTDLLALTPSRNAGARSGFKYDVGETVCIARNSTARKIGEAVIEAASLCV